MVSHTGTRIDARIGDLDGPAQAPGIPCRQRIDDQNHIGPRLLHHALDDLQRFHAGLGHDTRHQRTHLVGPFPFKGSPSILPDHMAGDLNIAHNPGPQSVRRHIPVSQAHHQHRLFPLADHFFQMIRQLLRNLPVIILILTGHIRGLHRDIGAHGLSHGPGPVFRLDFHQRGPDLLLFILSRLHPYAPDLHIILFKAFSCLQSQVRTDMKISQHKLLPFYIMMYLFFSFFS